MTWREFLTALGCAVSVASAVPACTLDVAAIRQPAPECDAVDQQMQICTSNSYSVYVFGYYHQCSRDFSPDCRRCIVETVDCNDLGSRCKAQCAPMGGSGSLKNPDGGASDLAR